MNKKLILCLIIILILIIFAFCFRYFIRSDDDKNSVSDNKIYDLFEVFDLINIEEISKLKCKDKVSKKYDFGSNSFVVNGDIRLGEELGKVYFIRDNKKYNLYVQKYRIDKYDSIGMQVEGIIEKFEEEVKSYLGIFEEKPKYEIIEGNSETKYQVPLGEKIYNQDKLYCKTYEVQGKEYEMNFYKENEELVCELVYKIK